MATATNVSAGKPKIGGAVYRAPAGTTLPTDASTALANAFVALGYCSDSGLTNSNSPETDAIKAWGGDTVMTIQTSKEDTFAFTLIEALNVDVLKAIYGDTNVSGTLSTGITITANSKEQTESIYVFELVMRGGAVKRIVIPSASLTEMGDVVYNDNDPVGYEMTLTALPDSSGNTHYEYLLKA